MRGNRKHNTRPEILLQQGLRKLGLRFRKHIRDLAGEPDVAFPKVKVAVFCDGDFWHGRNWRGLKAKLAQRANAQYWIAKNAANRRRDIYNVLALRREGWTVIRIWETDITRNPHLAARQVERILLRLRGDHGR